MRKRLFQRGFIPKVWVSKLQGAAEDQPIPFPIYMCMKCDHVNKGFNPFEEEEKTLIND